MARRLNKRSMIDEILKLSDVSDGKEEVKACLEALGDKELDTAYLYRFVVSKFIGKFDARAIGPFLKAFDRTQFEILMGSLHIDDVVDMQFGLTKFTELLIEALLPASPSGCEKKTPDQGDERIPTGT